MNNKKIRNALEKVSQAFEVQDRQEQDFLVQSRRYATTIVKFVNELVKLGYSPLDVLIHDTCRIPEGNRKIYKMVGMLYMNQDFSRNI